MNDINQESLTNIQWYWESHAPATLHVIPDWGALRATPVESGAEPQPKYNLVHLSLKIWPLVTIHSFIHSFILFFKKSWQTQLIKHIVSNQV